jgi:hypothetical protein
MAARNIRPALLRSTKAPIQFILARRQVIAGAGLGILPVLWVDSEDDCVVPG